MAVIRVYIDCYCLGCRRSEELINQILAAYPNLDASTVDVAGEAEVPDSLFALPTWYVNDEVWMLGNPSWDELVDLVERNGR